jgi:hypothetical protein
MGCDSHTSVVNQWGQADGRDNRFVRVGSAYLTNGTIKPGADDPGSCSPHARARCVVLVSASTSVLAVPG